MIRALKGRRVARTPDPRQADFLSLLEGAIELPAVPPSAEPATGTLAFDQRMRRLLNEAIKAGPFPNREALAEVVSFHAGRKVSKAMIDIAYPT